MLSKELVEFIRATFTSLTQLEILLLLYRGKDRTWTAREVAQQLRAGDEIVRHHLAAFAARGFLRASSDTPIQYQFSCINQTDSDLIDELHRSYATYRIRITELIFSRSKNSLSLFADAFKLKKGDE